jgi:hypothetical protein
MTALSFASDFAYIVGRLANVAEVGDRQRRRDHLLGFSSSHLDFVYQQR